MLPDERPLSDKAERRLSETIRPDHMRVDLHLARNNWADHLDLAIERARRIRTGIELVVYVTDQVAGEIDALVTSLNRLKPRLVRCLVLIEDNSDGIAVTPEHLFLAARSRISVYDPSLAIGLGTDLYFTELNRDRPDLADVDFITYTVNPQVHAFDNRSIVETLNAQRETVKSARRFCGEVPIAISPVTWHRRGLPRDQASERTLPPDVDTRQMSLFGAGFTLGTLKSFGESGVFSITLHGTSGWYGILETVGGSPLPGQFPAPEDCVYPIFHLLADIREFSGGVSVPVTESHPSQFVAFLAKKEKRQRLILVNLTGQEIEVECPWLLNPASMMVIDESNVRKAMMDPEAFRQEAEKQIISPTESMSVKLRRYAYARIDLQDQR
jgi:hypothetical protein